MPETIRDVSEKDPQEQEILQLMIDAGLMRPCPKQASLPPLSEEERRALAEEISHAPDKSTSKIVIEDRGEA